MNLSYSVVFYRNPIAEVLKIYQNIVKTVPASFEYNIYFINNSKDDCQLTKCLNQLQDSDAHVHSIISATNSGFGAGHNLAIKRIDSDLHFLVNPDITIPDTQQINKLVNYMQNQDVVMCTPKVLNTDGSIQKLVKRTPTVLDMGIRFLGSRVMPRRQRWFVYDDEYDEVHQSKNLAGSFLVCRTDILKTIGGFDERYFLYMEDSDLTRSMAEYGSTVFYPEAYVFHAWQRQNRKSLKGILNMLQSMDKYFNKWGWKFW